MKRIVVGGILLTILQNMLPQSAFGEDDSQAYIVAEMAKVEWGQYMAVGCQPISRAGWESFPLQLCQYNYLNGKVPVVLLNADTPRVTSWAITACKDADLSDVPACVERLALRIKCNSGNQFPVTGFVAENGILYIFRDGVTSDVAGAFLDGQSPKSNHIGLPTDNDVTAVMGRAKTVNSLSFGRVIGTDRHQYASYAKIDPHTLDGLAWSVAVKTQYQQAWNSNRNALFSAWAVSQKSFLNRAYSFAQFYEGPAGCPAHTKWTRWARNL